MFILTITIKAIFQPVCGGHFFKFFNCNSTNIGLHVAYDDHKINPDRMFLYMFTCLLLKLPNIYFFAFSVFFKTFE